MRTNSNDPIPLDKKVHMAFPYCSISRLQGREHENHPPNVVVVVVVNTTHMPPHNLQRRTRTILLFRKESFAVL